MEIKRLRFTLLELFIVMIIIVIMLAILLPLYERMGAGGRVKSTARLVGSQLSLARQLAQSKRSYIALILPGNEATYAGTCALPERHKFSIYRLAYVTKSGNDYNFSSWVEDSKWIFSPKGSSIMEADQDVGIYGDIGSSPWKDYVAIPQDNISTLVDNVPFANPLVDKTCNLVGDDVRSVVFAPSGKPEPFSAFNYITIGEAYPVWNGTVLSSWEVINKVDTPTNQSCANQITLEINGFTGGISYETPEDY